MCWQVQIVVNLQDDVPKNRKSLTLPKTTAFEVIGKFPKFELQKNTCACDLVHDARGKIDGLIPTVEHFLSQTIVKSVEVLWFWLSEEPKAPPLEKVELTEFHRKAERAELKQDTVFRVFKIRTANHVQQRTSRQPRRR